MDNLDVTDMRTGLEIAVIGMAGRFPGARNVEEFWENLKNGVESITFFSDRELEESGIDPELIRNPGYVKAKGLLEDVEYFDARFFDYTAAEASTMDPQLRIFHQCAWEALEDAGYDPYRCNELIGLYAGAGFNPYWVARHLPGMNSLSRQFEISSLNAREYLTTRVSYKLNLKGPAVTVLTACSTSLVAVHLACQGILSGECDMALAGGISILFPSFNLPRRYGNLYQEGMVLSPDGHCRAFDAGAKGTNSGDGVGIVVLKSLEAAIAERDHIYAVVRGSAVNNDGNNKVGYTAPSAEAQAEVIRAALSAAEVEADTIHYIETHGTGTALGDPIEIEGLKMVFDADREQPCAIGSVKTNFGHLDTAAGVTGFIKTVLALKYGLIPPSLHFETSNPDIDFENSAFYVNTTLSQWRNGDGRHLLRAGVSSFGIGGTNAHVILEQAPVIGHSSLVIGEKREERENQLILLSAKTETALEQMEKNLGEYLGRNPGIHMADVAYTLQKGRSIFSHRSMLVCSNNNEAVDALLNPDSGKIRGHFTKPEDSPVIIFMFPGLGAQYVNMGLELYQTEPVFRQEMDRCFEILKSITDYNIKEILYPASRHDRSNGYNRSNRSYRSYNTYQSHNNQIEIDQVVVFIFEYALAKLLISWGIKPDAVIGYSFGEYTAACLSEVFSLEDALKIIVTRGKLLTRVPGGAMLSVPLPVPEVAPLLSASPGLSVAIDNGSSCIVAGPGAVLADFEQEMKQKKLMCMPVPHSVAMHSPMMDPILMEFEDRLKSITLNPPGIPYISNVTGTWIMGEEAATPTYWKDHLRKTVRFADGLTELAKKSPSVFIEVGPARDLSIMVQRIIQDNPAQKALNLVKPPQKKVSDIYYLLKKIGYLWLYGLNINWSGFYTQERRCRVSLPTYPFEKKRYYPDGPPLMFADGIKPSGPLIAEKNSMEKWFYTSQWLRTPLLPDIDISSQPGCWLLFLDGGESLLEHLLVDRLRKNNHRVVIARPGSTFEATNGCEYTINIRSPIDYDRMFKELLKAGSIPVYIIHMWNVTGEDRNKSTLEELDKTQDLGLYSLLNIARAIGNNGISDQVQLGVITDNMQPVLGEEELQPEKATILGPVKIVPLEYANIHCRSIDIQEPGTKKQKAVFIIDNLMAEFCMGFSRQQLVAYRGCHRWVECYQPVDMNNRSNKVPRLKEKGVYLVTGGFGGMGFKLVENLAQTLNARLILVDLLDFSGIGSQDEWLVSDERKRDIRLKKQKIKEMEKNGAEFQVYHADVSDYHRMKAVISKAEENFGKIDGVIHTAGLIDYAGVIQRRTREMTENLLAAKVKGTLVLDELLEHHDLDFMILFSSIGNIFYKLKFGQVGYNAGHEFLDVFSYQKQKQGTFATTIDWNDWSEVGMAVRAADEESLFDEKLLAISPLEGIEVFQRILGNNLYRVTVSPWQIENALAFIDNTLREKGEKATSGEMFERPKVSTPFVPPENDIQRTIAFIWEKYFGIKQVGIHDDFFELGGDSLKAMNVSAIIREELGVEIPVTQFFEGLTVEALAQYAAAGGEKEEGASIEPLEKQEYYILSSAQKRLYVLHQLGEGDTTYNETMVAALEGHLVKKKLENTFKQLIKRHESFRTSFGMVGGEPMQKIHDHAALDIQYLAVDRMALVNQAVKDFIKPFDFTKAPLMRVGLVRVEQSPHTHILIVDMHHMITDGVSHEIIIDEFLILYNEGDLPELVVQYKEYSQWQDHLLQSGELKNQENYWLKEFESEVPELTLPTDYPRPPLQSFEGARIRFTVGSRDTQALKEIISKQDATLFMVLLAIFNIFLSKLSGRDDIVVGTLIAGRKTAEFQKVIGMFVNTMALRNFPLADNTFTGFLESIKKRTLAAYENQEYQFERLVDNVVKNRDTSRNPLFDAIFILQNLELMRERETGGLKIKPYPNETTRTKFDLRLDGMEQVEGKGLVFWFEYSTKLFKPETIKRLITYFKNVVSVVVKDPLARIGDIEVITKEEKEQLVYKFNHTQAAYPGDKPLHELFAEQAGRTPDHVAIETAGRQSQRLSYQELNKEADRIALILRLKGAAAGIVGMMINRSLEAVITILAIFKSGGAFLPIDPDYPAERIHFMLTDSRANLLVTTRGLAEPVEKVKQWQGEKLFLEDLAKISASPAPVFRHQPSSASLAYVIYTSGSTGNPKGVMIDHRSIVNYIWWAIKQYVREEKVDFPLFTSLSFDLTLTSIFIPILSGSTVFVYEGEGKESLIQKVIEENRVGAVKLTPSHLKLIGEQAIDFPSSKRFIVGGEALETKLAGEVVKKFHGDIEIYNEYGPTEAAVGCMIYKYCPGTDTRQSVPIGIPANNVQVYILDKERKPVPVNVPGEMYIAGHGVARGYLNQPELTREKFVGNPFLTGKRMYKTGDLARHLADGNMEFLGRIDQQVKIRGFRIELGGIRNKLMEYRKNNPIIFSDEDFAGQDLKNIQRCQKCLLSANYPGIHFNDHGVCSICEEYEQYKEEVERYFKPREDFERLVEETRETGQGEYDCLLLYSGGKDSTYVLYQLIDMGLKVLTFTFDNGYISDAAFANIKRTTSALNVENIIYKAENMNKVFVESLNTDNDVCHGCWNALNTTGIKVAHENKIKLVISGLSRGQIFEMRLEGLFQEGVYDEEKIEENLLLFRKSFHSKNNKFARLLDIDLAEEVVEHIHFVDFFRYYDTPVSEIRAYLSERGWTQPKDTGFCSSNCIINDVGICVHLKKTGCHFYEPQLSWDCRLGALPRNVGLKDIVFDGNRKQEQVNRILKEIGYYNPPIKDAVVVDEEGKNSDRTITAYLVSDDELLVPELREYLAGQLPDYMIPSDFIRVEKIPLTLNGKVDRRALQALGKKIDSGVEYVAPQSSQEIFIADIWKEILKKDEISVHDNFFDLGGTSVDIIRVNSHIREAFAADVPIVAMYKYTTIASFSQFLSSGELEPFVRTSESRLETIKRGKADKQRMREKRIRRRHEYGT